MADHPVGGAVRALVLPLLVAVRCLLSGAAPRCGSCGKLPAEVGPAGGAFRFPLALPGREDVAYLFLVRAGAREPERVCLGCAKELLHRLTAP